ncbi:MAG: aspartate aminotransferase family protein [Deltaproteobacteria bacterium]|nr:aspartate aminotransferase family protein [Deltaproteobacteria bacterium]
MSLPAQGWSRDEVLGTIDTYRAGDANWRAGRTFSLVYYAGEEVKAVAEAAFLKLFAENALNPMAFPSLRRMETEVLAIAAELLGDRRAVGTMTSGGTESILMAVKTARDWARQQRPEVTAPEMLVPATVHPAFHKAAHYFGVRAVVVPVAGDYRADVEAARKLLSSNTILVVGSSFAYPHGVIDPIAELAQLAQEAGILCHVDACLGGMILPFVERLGHPLPPWNLAVPGVTSISCDLHKYGYTAKGASVVLYTTRELRRHQFMGYADWPGGLWGSPSAAGTRPGGPIAAAWAVLHFLGENGYLRIARQSLEAAKTIQAGIAAIPGMLVLAEPAATVFAFCMDDGDTYRLGDAMQARGWNLDRQQSPPALHAMITAAHVPHVEAFRADLRAAAEEVRGLPPASEGEAAMYGMMGSLPDRGMAHEMIVGFLDSLG